MRRLSDASLFRAGLGWAGLLGLGRLAALASWRNNWASAAFAAAAAAAAVMQLTLRLAPACLALACGFGSATTFATQVPSAGC